MISCSDAVRQLWNYLDDAVEEADRQAIEEHLEVCQRCCGEVEFAHELRAFLTTHAFEDLPGDTRSRLTSFLEQI